jgi:hypothetical protein
MGYIVTYGEGGYDPSKPNNNIVEIKDDETMTPLPIEETDADSE